MFNYFNPMYCLLSASLICSNENFRNNLDHFNTFQPRILSILHVYLYTHQLLSVRLFFTVCPERAQKPNSSIKLNCVFEMGHHGLGLPDPSSALEYLCENVYVLRFEHVMCTVYFVRHRLSALDQQRGCSTFQCMLQLESFFSIQSMGLKVA